jgi:hypothetical protein
MAEAFRVEALEEKRDYKWILVPLLISGFSLDLLWV